MKRKRSRTKRLYASAWRWLQRRWRYPKGSVERSRCDGLSGRYFALAYLADLKKPSQLTK